MYKQALVGALASMLLEGGYRTVECRGSRSSFDLIARKDDRIFLVKVLSNIEALSRERAQELKNISSLLGGYPVVVSENMKNHMLSDGVVYDRYDVSVMNPSTFSLLINEGSPQAYSKRGSYCVEIDKDLLSRARKKLGYTQDDLAHEMGVSKQSIYRYENSGSVSIEVFEKMVEVLGENLLRTDFRLSQMPAEQQTIGLHLTPLKKLVDERFRNMGFKTTITNAPFDMVAAKGDRIFSVVSNDWRRLSEKLSVLEEMSSVLDGYTVCISERRVKSSVSVLNPDELSEIRSAREFFKRLSK
ncbi:MAG: helix-turn-helix domain-containing protein [Candidatus Altiarchaeota archaeon]|nr:helix-turn-helix domain-containing protein [Candidatus Altiarchaeota archaeon]